VDLVNGSTTVHTVKGGEIDLETPEVDRKRESLAR
jgi:hypothetical protein